MTSRPPPLSRAPVGLGTIAREWGRVGSIGFGGPPAHIALFRQLCVVDRGWLPEREFEDGIAATNLLPGPASTQLAIFCAWRLRGPLGAVVGGVCFIVPGLVAIIALAALFLAAHPPVWMRGAAAGAGAAVPAVAVQAAAGLLPASWRRAGRARPARSRWVLYVAAGGVAAATIGPWLVVVLALGGLIEVVARRPRTPRRPPTPPTPGGPPTPPMPPAPPAPPAPPGHGVVPLLAAPAALVGGAGGIGALVWVAIKVGLLSYGGGFVIIPLMQHDAVHTYHWMTGSQFLDAVALGQVTPGPVVQTVAVVGYAAAGIGGALLASVMAFTPSFLFVLLGGPRFDQIRSSRRVQAFLIGAGAAAIGAIAGSAIPLGRALAHLWQFGVLALAAAWLLARRPGVVTAIVGAGVLGAIAGVAGAPLAN